MSDSPAASESVQRYANVYWKSSGSHHVVEDAEGEYVKWDDYEALLAEVKRLKDERGEFICTRCYLRQDEREKVDAGF